MRTTLLSILGLATLAAAAPLEERQTPGNMALYLDSNAQGFDINTLQTFRLSYANSSAYLGQIKYQSYAEPLIVGDFTQGKDNSVSFLSIHQSPTGYQQMYVVPHQTQPVGFSVPHGGAPQGVSTTGFSFGPRGALLHNGVNRFYACQNAALAQENSYQLWWVAGGQPNGVGCVGPIKIVAGDACART
jgi:hypothetical protein